MLIALQTVLAIIGFYLMFKTKNQKSKEIKIKPAFKILFPVITILIIFGIPTAIIYYDFSFSKMYTIFQYALIMIQILAIGYLLIKNKKALLK